LASFFPLAIADDLKFFIVSRQRQLLAPLAMSILRRIDGKPRPKLKWRRCAPAHRL